MIAQHILNKILNIPYKGRYNKIRILFLQKIRNLILRFIDPCIKYNIGDETICLPFSHNLPIILKTYPQYSSNLPRIATRVKQTYNHMTFIDIGANVGDTIALLRSEVLFPILCVEGEEKFFKYLQKNAKKFSNIKLEKVFLGSENKEIHGNTEILNGTAKIVPQNSVNQVIYIKKLSDIVKEHKEFSKAKMIKIDTDGFDCMIIRGSLDFLRIAKPVIFFEYDPFLLEQQNDDGISVFSDLRYIGYDSALIYDNIGNYMMSLELANELILQEIHNYFLQRYKIDGGYCDICVFHSDDKLIFEELRNEELTGM